MIPESLHSAADGKILSGVENHIGYLVINNADRHNAISLAMWSAAADALAVMATDTQVRALVVTGAGGKAFASGADIAKFETERSTTEAVGHYHETSGRFYHALEHFPKPTLAIIRGYCIGGGLALAITCDLRLCTSASRFGVPAAKLGVGYGYAGIERLSRLVNVSTAKEIFFTARQFSADEALQMGLVNRVLEDDKLEDYAADARAVWKPHLPWATFRFYL
ncbi:MAG: enoyl-CoA hydratase-related protein [Pseudomonadota bacterium]